ncbi:Chromosome partition protein Smc [Planctomycetes bacterium Pan216]|uniref:Chromosome partition protein Smc n=1 Tax=Kolteria novifilia TaxID=2527975 RepID=A0A518BAY1_9BACT|nr:Chromosome partition protein Smc [Planctomycetes bacterium Pan216]
MHTSTNLGRRLVRGAVACLGLLALVEGSQARAADEKKITFEDHILPIFRERCLSCHDASKARGDLTLATFDAALAGGGSGEVLMAGDPDGSRLLALITGTEEPKMPPNGSVPANEIALVKAWIAGGLLKDINSKPLKPSKPKNDLSLGDAPTGRPEGPPPMPENLPLEPVVHTSRAGAITAMAASPWAPLVAIAGHEQVVLYNPETFELLGILPFPEGTAHELAFTRNGKYLMAGGGFGAELGRVVLWDIKNGKRVMEVGEEYDAVLTADIRADQANVAIGGTDKLAKVLDTGSGELLHTLKKHTDWVMSVAFSPDGVLLATGDRAGGLVVWEADTGREFYVLNGHKAAIQDMAWRRDSNVLATVDEAGQVRLWDMHQGKPIKNWGAHGGGTLAVDYAHDGRLVTCGRDRMVRVWDGNGKKLRDCQAFGDIAMQVAFHHDGKKVIAGDWTGDIRVYNVDDGKPVGTLTSNPPPMSQQLALVQKAFADRQAEFTKLSDAATKAKANANQKTAELAADRKATEEAKGKINAHKNEIKQLEKKVADGKKALGEQRKLEAAKKNETNQKNRAVSTAGNELKKAQQSREKLGKELASKEADAKRLADEASKRDAESKAKADDAKLKQVALKAIEASKKAAVAAVEAKSRVAGADKLVKERQDALNKAKADAEKTSKEFAAAQAQVASTKKMVDDAIKRVQALKKELPGIEKFVRDAPKRIKSREDSLKAANEALAKAQSAANASKVQLDILQKRVEKWQQALAKQPGGQAVSKR